MVLCIRQLKLMREKHGQDFGADIADFLQANALLRDNILKGEENQ